MEPERAVDHRAQLRTHVAWSRRQRVPAHVVGPLRGVGQLARRASRRLRDGVTGVICGSDVLALGAIRAVRRAGLSVPGDEPVVGYDDSAIDELATLTRR